ncbi:MAG: DUF4369 domain-containing protein [Bacteroidales bacterium]
MIRKIGFIAIVFYFLVSCSQKNEVGNATISGQLSELTGETVYLEELEVRSAVLLDSVNLAGDGKFRFKVQTEDAGFYILRNNPENYIPLLVEKGESVEVFSDNSILQNGYTVKNSPGSELLLDYERFMNSQKKHIDSIAMAYENSKGTDNFLKTKEVLDSIFLIIYSDQQNYVRDFIKDHPGSLASLIVMNRKLGRNKVLDEEEDFIYFHKLDSALMIQYPENKHALDHHARVKEIQARIFDNYNADKKLQPGKKAPNIVGKDTSGTVTSLKQYMGKPVLVYFWAGWNAKSRLDNKTLISIYPRLKKHNIEIFGVSLDENETVWKGALKLDKLPGFRLVI